MLNIETRTSEAQGAALLHLLTEISPGAILHKAQHNLDGLWLNVYLTDRYGDWVASIDRDGNIERTQ